MSKGAIIDAIIADLNKELARYTVSMQSAHAEATDEQSKAENKYDTRGLEASYLARGQSQQAADVMQAIHDYQALAERLFEPKEPIGIGALVQLEGGNRNIVYFVGPRAGGIEIDCDGQTVVVITPNSPLGKQLIGRKQAERLQITIGGTSESYQVVLVT